MPHRDRLYLCVDKLSLVENLFVGAGCNGADLLTAGFCSAEHSTIIANYTPYDRVDVPGFLVRTFSYL